MTDVSIAAYRDRVGTRLLTGQATEQFDRFTLAAATAEKRTPCYSNPDLFFNPDTVAEAKAACAACPLQFACLNFALDHRQIDGVWGGLSESERANILRARRAQKQKQWKREREARAAAAQSDTLFEMAGA